MIEHGHSKDSHQLQPVNVKGAMQPHSAIQCNTINSNHCQNLNVGITKAFAYTADIESFRTEAYIEQLNSLDLF